MINEAILNQLGYSPNEALKEQMDAIVKNTNEFKKIEKHIYDLHNILKVDDSYVAMSNSFNYLKIKLQAKSPELLEEAHEKVQHFADKFKVELKKVEGHETYYIIGFKNSN
ncbi:MAG: hypothetical protein U9N42_10745 [Campylobacterota bacterium]|nr:hypothetical protein [Campylobacterota bacterium]